MDKNKVGFLIASLRKEKNMTQKDLADKLFVSDKAVSKWERGLCMPDISLIEKVAEVLEVSISEIIKGEKINKFTKAHSDEIVKEGIIFFQKTYFKEKVKTIFLFITVIIIPFILFGIVDCYRAARGKDPIFLNGKASVESYITYTDTNYIDSDRTDLYYGWGYMVIKCSRPDERPYYIFQLGHKYKHVCYHGDIE